MNLTVNHPLEAWLIKQAKFIRKSPWNVIGFIGNRAEGPRTGNWARPRVVDRRAEYRGILLNTDTN